MGVLYVFIRIVPAGVYMPRRYISLLADSAATPSSLGFILTHYIEHADYSVGLWVLLNKGPCVHYDVVTEIVANIKIGPELSLTPICIKAARQPDHISSITEWDNTIAYIASGSSEEAWLTLFDEGDVRKRKGVIEDRLPPVLQLDDEDVLLGGGGMRFGRRMTDLEWTLFDKERPTLISCYISRTCATRKKDVDRRWNVTLYTACAEGGLSTNVYHCPLSNIGVVTAMGTPTNAYFASFGRKPSSSSPAFRVPDQLTYTIWNRSGVVRMIKVRSGISPEAEVCPYAADGRHYIVYLFKKKTKRHTVTVGVTFVDLESGQQTEREVAVSIPRK